MNLGGTTRSAWLPEQFM